jgi:2'-5' RNA ligase
VRLFVAVEIDPAVRAAAAAAGEALRARLDHAVDARWIPEQNLHITLWFIGEVADERVPALLASLDAPFAVAPFDLEIDGLGAFPPSGPPRVFWLGVRRGGDALAALHGEMSRRLEPHGFIPERRPYSAHLTIARVRETGRRGGLAAVRRALSSGLSHAGTSRVTAVTVFRSRLSPKGASYEPVLRVPLNG